ncbi:MAG: GDP-mannose 4,6-dehydratase [Candidatus Omnitrophota bacterium]
METSLKGSKVLVTGINGFIGSHLARELIASGAAVSGLIRQGADLWRIKDIAGKVTLLNADIRDYAQVQVAIRKACPKKVFHLAAYVNVSRSWEHSREMIDTNLLGTINLLHSLEGGECDCFINSGTCEEYGDNPTPFTEDQCPNPVSPYSASKAAATLFCGMIYKTKKVPIVTLRPFLTYGPQQVNNMLIPYVIQKALLSQDIEMTKGEQTREFNYVADIVDGYIRASVTPQALGEVINIGNATEYKIIDVVRMILKMLGNPVKPKAGALAYRPGETMHFYCDNTKARTILKWKPKVSLEEGLKKTIEWYLAHKDRKTL